MSIRSKTTLAFVIVSTVAIGLSIWAISVRLLSGFHAIELDRAREDQAQVKAAFWREVTNTETKLADWAQWDDTHAFINDFNQKYIDSNLNPESLVQLKINGIIYVKDGAVQHAVLIDPEAQVVATLSAGLASHATASGLLSPLVTSDAVQSEVAIIDDTPMILSARGIYMSSGDGLPAGQIIFVKHITPKVIQELRDTTTMDFTVTPYTSAAMTGEIGEEMLEDQYADDKEHIHIESDTELESDLIIRNTANIPILYVKLHMFRKIYMQGLETVRMLAGVGVFWGVSFIVILLFLLDRLVLRRLEKINENIVAIDRSKDPARRIEGLSGNDEMGGLVATINSMLESLEQTGKDLQVKNADLESSKSAMLNILEDERDMEVALKHEKENIERKIIERTKELEGEKARLLASINSLNMGYVLTDTEGSIITSNNQIRTIFNLPEAQFALTDIDNRLGSEFDLLARFHSCLSDNKKLHDENVALGSAILRMYLIPVALYEGDAAKVIGAVLLVEDVTEQRVLERSKDEFFSIASHELRTPLTAIRGNSSLIKEYYQDAMKDPSLAEMINDMHESSIRLISIVNDFLDMSRLEMKKIEFLKDTFSINKLVDECILEFQGIERERHIPMLIGEASDAEVMVTADKNKVKQVVLNLLSNAFKFTEQGTISIDIHKDPEHKLVMVSVTDTGKGISEAGKRLLFHKFQQAQDNTLTRDMTQGTGLGLYISKLMVEGMGGTIRLAQTAVGKGSTFTFTLPLFSE